MLHVIDEPDQTITVDAGHRIEIEVPENASTAYVWHVAAIPAGVRATGDEMRPPEGLTPGGGGSHVFRFAVDEANDGEICLELRRPWESSVEATFRLHVTTAAR